MSSPMSVSKITGILRRVGSAAEPDVRARPDAAARNMANIVIRLMVRSPKRQNMALVNSRVHFFVAIFVVIFVDGATDRGPTRLTTKMTTKLTTKLTTKIACGQAI
jgi:hypothetical protein